MLQRLLHGIFPVPVAHLQKIKAPVLLIWGENDRMIPSSLARSYAQVLQQSETVVLPHLGHVLQEEQPEVGLAQVKAFFKRLGIQSGG